MHDAKACVGSFAEVEHEAVVLLVHQRADGGADLLHRRADVERLGEGFHLAALDLAQIEHVVDQAKQVAGVALDLGDVAGEVWRLRPVLDLFRDHLGVADDRRKRRTQLVAHVGEEARLGPVRRFRVHRAVPQLLAEAFLHLDLILELSVHRAKPVGRLDALRDVEDEDVEAVDGAVRVLTRQVADVGDAVASVAMRPGQLELGRFAGQHLREVLASKLELRWSGEVEDRPTDHLLRLEVEPVLVGAIGELVGVVPVDERDEDRQGIGDQADVACLLRHALLELLVQMPQLRAGIGAPDRVPRLGRDLFHQADLVVVQLRDMVWWP